MGLECMWRPKPALLAMLCVMDNTACSGSCESLRHRVQRGTPQCELPRWRCEPHCYECGGVGRQWWWMCHLLVQSGLVQSGLAQVHEALRKKGSWDCSRLILAFIGISA